MLASAFADMATMFFRPAQRFVNATLENPRFSLNDPAAYEYLAGGSKSAAGVAVTHENAITLGGVHQAVSLITGDISKLPLYVFKRLPEDDREIADKHPGYFPVAVRANPYESARRFWRTFGVHCLIWGNGYGFISRKTTGTELYHLLPDRTASEWVKIPDKSARGYHMEYFFLTEVEGQLQYLTPDRVFHVPGISLDGSKGADLVAAARDEWGLALAQRNFQSKFFKNGARMGGTLELPAGMSKPARDTVEEGFRKSYEEGDNPFKTVILRDSAKFHAGQVTPEQSQLTDSRDQEKREIASFFNIPPSKLGIRDSVSYNSFEQDNLSYLHGCLHHWLDPIADEANMKLLTEDELRKDSHYFEHNYSKYVQADWKTLNDGLEIMRRNEIINADEWRRKLNMNKRPDGGGGAYINPNTKSAAESAAKEEKPPKPEKKPATAHKALFVDTFARMARRVGFDARKAATDPKRFLTWIDSNAADHRTVFHEAVLPVAAAYCETFGGSPSDVCAAASVEFFDGPGNANGGLMEELRAFTEAPHSADDLKANVERGMNYFEKFAPERVAAKIMENANA